MKNFFRVIRFAVRISIVFGEGTTEVGGCVTLVRIQSIRVLYLLNSDMHLNIRENWFSNVVYKSNHKTGAPFLPPPFPVLLYVYGSFLQHLFWNFFVLSVDFLGIVRFLTTTFGQLQFQGWKSLSQIKVIGTICLKIKLYAVLFQWGSRTTFMFVGRQDIVNNWDFLSWISKNRHKRLVTGIFRLDQWEQIVSLSFREGLVCIAIFFGTTLLACLTSLTAFRFPLWPPNSFPRVCLPILFAAALDFFSVTKNLCYSSVQQVTTSQQRPVLQPGQHFKAKMELWFSQ